MPQPLPITAPSLQPARWVVFGAAKEGNAFGATLASMLAADGPPTVLVTPGPAYGCAQLNGDAPLLHATVDPTTPATFHQLLADLLGAPAEQSQPVGIVYLWGMAQTQSALGVPSDNVPERTVQSAAALLYLVQALLEHESTATLFVVTSHSQPFAADRMATDPVLSLPTVLMGERAVGGALWGLARTIPLEHPRLRCHCIDLHDIDRHAGVDGQTVAALQRELLAGLAQDSSETELLYRHQTRYVARLALATTSRPGTAVTPVISDTSSYLITGGLGALGLQVAEHLVAAGARYLILSSRRGLTADLPGAALVQERLQILQAKGAVIHIEPADVSQPADVSRLLAACQTLAPLRGIVHTAGVLDDGLIQQQSLARLAQVMAPKVQGAWLLHTLTCDLPLDFFVGFSSIASLFGSPGQSNYAAANGFMDALLQQRAVAGLPGLTINWGPWADVGMAATLASQQSHRRNVSGFQPMPPSQAASLVRYVIEQKVSQVGIFALEPHAVDQHDTLTPPMVAALRPAAEKQPTVAPSANFYEQLLTLAADTRADHLFQYLRLTVAQTLGIAAPEQVGARQPLFALGLDSLMALELKNRLETSLKVSLRSTPFDYPTLEQVTASIYLGAYSQPRRMAARMRARLLPPRTMTLPIARFRPRLPLLPISQMKRRKRLLETLKNL
ncbi:MAG: beta-ketoacyl reductase [Caldilineaceae bacterium]